MSDLSNVIEGESYFAKVYEAVADYNEKQKEGSGKYQWEINVAVDQEVYDAFKEAGFNAGMRLEKQGMMAYSNKPVITFLKWATDYNGNLNKAPIVMDTDKATFEGRIENGSKVKVQWEPYAYGKGRYKRPMLLAVQVVELVEQAKGEISDDEVAF